MDEFEAKIFSLRKQKYDIIGELNKKEHPPYIIQELKRQKRILDSLIKEAIVESKRDGNTGTSTSIKQNI